MKQLYIDAANKYIPLLQQYEHAPQTIITVNDGETNEDFINDLLNTEERKMKYRNHLSDEFYEWNNWYIKKNHLRKKTRRQKELQVPSIFHQRRRKRLSSYILQTYLILYWTLMI